MSDVLMSDLFGPLYCIVSACLYWTLIYGKRWVIWTSLIKWKLHQH